MADIEYEFEGPGECEECRSMVGTVSDAPIGELHPNCNCTSRPRCENDFDVNGSSTRYGPNGECFIFNAEITVTCWDDSTRELSVPIDMGCASYDDVFGAIEAVAGEEAGEMDDSCPECEELVS